MTRRDRGDGGVPLGIIEKRERAPHVAGQPRGVGRREQQLVAGVVDRRQAGGALERRGGDRVGAPLARPGTGLLERTRRLVVRADARCRQVPRAPVDVPVGKRRRQGRVGLAALPRGRLGVHGRTRERMRELDLAGTDRHQTSLLRGREIADVQSDRRGGSREHGDGTWVARRRRARARDASARASARNDAGTTSRCSSRSEPARRLTAAQAELASGASSSSASGLPPVARYRRSTRVGPECPAARAAPLRPRGRARPCAASAGRRRPAAKAAPSRTVEDERDRIRQEPPRGEQQRLRARAIEPVRVVHEQRERTILRACGQQAERRGPDRKAVAGAAPARARARPRARSPAAAGSGPTRRAPDAAARPGPRTGSPPRTRSRGQCRIRIPSALLGRVFEQGGLADARLADEREHAAAAFPRLRKQAIERQPLVFAAQQHQSILTLWRL